MIRGISNITIPSVNNYIAQGPRMSLPVDPRSMIYSHFRYVSGTPAPEGSYGVAISKLNLLDVLIGQLNQLRQSNAQNSGLSSNLGQGMSDEAINALMEQYTSEIRQAKALSEAMPYISAPSAEAPSVLSLSI